MDKIKICIVDSGIKSENLIIPDNVNINLYDCTDGNVKLSDNGFDEIGHGTAISSIILKFGKCIEINSFKIFKNSLICDEQLLLNTLYYIYENVDCNILNLSLGTVSPAIKDELHDICMKLNDKGVIIVSAFDNNGGISYPAVFDFVIGVDSSPNCRKYNDFEFVESDFVNILAFGGLQRLPWATAKFMIVSGASYASAYVTTAISNIMFEKNIFSKDKILLELKKISKKTLKVYKSYKKDINLDYIKNAILFPYNKEMHSIINFEDLLIFKIKGVYDYAKLGNVGKKVGSINGNQKKYTIQNISSLDWNSEFDTIILGHLEEIENTANENIKQQIIDLATKNNKNIYSFDDISSIAAENKSIIIQCPRKDINDIKLDTFGKLYQYKSPILGVFGTSSKQGKYTLQLELRKRFLNQKFKVGQLGTEPTALLFGMDEVYPMGYNSSVYLERNQGVLLLNQSMHEIDNKNNDIIIVGSQSGTVSYANYNIRLLPIFQIDFLYGTQPDAIILCINPYDEIPYISRTIKAIEGIVECKVIATALYPMSYITDWDRMSNRKVKITDEKILEIKNLIKDNFNLNCYTLGNKDEIDELYNSVIKFFA